MSGESAAAAARNRNALPGGASRRLWHAAFDHVSHSFKTSGEQIPVLDDVSFSVRRGTFLCVVGPSGCGKSTLLNLLGGFLLPASGSVTVNGSPVRGPSPRTVPVFQESGLFPWRNVLSNAAYGLEAAGVGRKEREARVSALLREAGLDAFRHLYPHQLSGGMKQRVALVRALAVCPELILMDEPLGALDVLTRAKMRQELERVWHSTGATVILVTHDVEEAVLLADRVIVLSERPARIIAAHDIDIPRPRNKFDAQFNWICREIYRGVGLI